MITLAALVVLSGPLIALILQSVPIPEGGKLAAEWISPAILCGVLVKLLWDERADSREARRIYDANRDLHEAETRKLIEQTTAALERVGTLLHSNAEALSGVQRAIEYCKKHGD